MSVKARMILSLVAVFVVGALVIAGAARQSFFLSLDRAAQSAVDRAAVILAERQSADEAKLASTLRGILDNDEYRELYLAGDRAGLYSAAKPVFDELKRDFAVTHWYFESTEESPSVFLRVHAPEQFGDALGRKTYKAAVANKGYGSGLELGKTAVALRVVHPYYAADGETVIGYMELGQEIDQFLEEIKAQSGDEAALILMKSSMDEAAWAAYREGKGLDNNWNDHEAYVVAASTSDEVAGHASAYDGDISALPAEGDVIGSFDEGNRQEARGAIPVKDVEGAAIGAVYVQHDISGTASSLLRERLLTMSVVLAMLFVLMGVMLVLMNRLIFGRLDAMMAGMEEISTRLAGGDFEVHYTPDGKKDEIGRFEEFFSRFIDTVAGTLKQLTK